MSPFMLRLMVGLDAVLADVPYEDFLSAVAILYAPDLAEAASACPESLTLDALHRVAWVHRMDIKITFKPRTP